MIQLFILSTMSDCDKRGSKREVVGQAGRGCEAREGGRGTRRRESEDAG